MLEASVAEYVTVDIPTENAAGASSVIVTALIPSDAVASPKITVVNSPVASADTSSGAVILGAVVSDIVTN